MTTFVNYLPFNDANYAPPQVATFEGGDAQALMDQYFDVSGDELDGNLPAFFILAGAGDGNRWSVTLGYFEEAVNSGVMVPFNGDTGAGLNIEMIAGRQLLAAEGGTAAEANAKLDALIATEAARTPAPGTMVLTRELAGSSSGARWMAAALLIIGVSPAPPAPPA